MDKDSFLIDDTVNLFDLLSLLGALLEQGSFSFTDTIGNWDSFYTIGTFGNIDSFWVADTFAVSD